MMILPTKSNAFIWEHLNFIHNSNITKRRVKGRLQLCSGSLLFDPEDIKLPILKLPFRHVEHIQQWKVIHLIQCLDSIMNNNNHYFEYYLWFSSVFTFWFNF